MNLAFFKNPVKSREPLKSVKLCRFIAVPVILAIGLLITVIPDLHAEQFPVAATQDAKSGYRSYTYNCSKAPDIPWYIKPSQAGLLRYVPYTFITVEGGKPQRLITGWSASGNCNYEDIQITISGDTLWKYTHGRGNYRIHTVADRPGADCVEIGGVDLEITTDDLKQDNTPAPANNPDPVTPAGSGSGDTPAATSGGTAGNGSGGSSSGGASTSANTYLAFDPEKFVYIKMVGVISFFSMAYFVYWIIVLTAAAADWIFCTDFWVRKVTRNNRSFDEDENGPKEIMGELIFGLFVIAAYFSGAYMYICYLVINICLMFTGMLSAMI